MLTSKNIFAHFLRDLFTGWSKPEAVYAWLLIGLQVAVFLWNPDSPAGFIAGLSGTICVLLVAKRKLSNYVFGLIQTVVGLYLGLQFRLWGESAENLFYFVSQIIGFVAWKKHMVTTEIVDDKTQLEQVETLAFTLKEWVTSLVAIAVGTGLLGFLFDTMQGTQPYIDALTLVTAIVAQLVMLARYREQWVFWFALNIVSIYQWVTLGNWSMVALYTAFIINNAYGYYQWTQGTKQ